MGSTWCFVLIYFDFVSCVWIFAYVYVHHMACLVPGAQRWLSGPLELELTGDCELPCRHWELNLGPQEEQPVFLNAELSPASAQCFCFHKLWFDPAL